MDFTFDCVGIQVSTICTLKQINTKLESYSEEHGKIEQVIYIYITMRAL